MPDSGVWAFSVRKVTSWRGNLQGFSNLYHYSMVTPSLAQLEATLDAIKAAEVPVHAARVTFTEGRVWGPVNPDGRGGQMQVVKPYTGTGGATDSNPWYREFAYLVYWELGRYGTRNRPQFLRKWIHSCTLLQGGANATDGNTDLGAITTPLSTYEAAVRAPSGAGVPASLQLQSASGHLAGTPGKLKKYLEHHQFGR